MTARPIGVDLPAQSMPSEVPGYFADTAGHVWSLRSGAPRRLVENIDHQGYPTVRLFLPGRRKPTRRKVPRIVAEAFHGQRPEHLQIRHMDGDPANNRPENLKYGTAVENAADRVRHGTQLRGEAAPAAFLTDGEVRAGVERVISGELIQDVAETMGIRSGALQRWCRGSRPDATVGLDLSAIPLNRRASGDRSPLAKVTDAQIQQMRAMTESGMTQAAVASIFGVHSATVSRFVRGAWRAAA